MPILYLLINFHSHKCAPLKEQKEIEYRDVSFEKPSKSRRLADGSSTRGKMRITFDTSPVKDGNPLQCSENNKGTRITWERTTAYCGEEELMNETKVETVVKTLANLKAYLESILSVDRLADGFTIRQQDETDHMVVTNTKQATNTDFYVIVVTRPYPEDSTILAQAESTLWTNKGRDPSDPDVPFSITRPIQGTIYINSRKIPLEPEDYNSPEREFFATLFHEMIHALGVTTQSFPHWRNPDNNNIPYGSRDNFPLKKYRSKRWRTSKEYNILTTKNAKEYAKKFFGITGDWFEEPSDGYEGIPVGIELEDGGGSGTEECHPEGRIYHDDFFVGFSVAPARFTSLALALLKDTGFYDVDESRAEPTAWLNNEAIGTEKDPSWAIGPPQKTWPDYYLCQPKEVGYEQCSYDLLSGAGCRGYKQDCTNITTEDGRRFCNMRDFADPKELNMMGPQWTHDFAFYKTPYGNIHCTDTHFNNNSQTTWNGENYGGESMCALSTLYKGYLSFYAQPHPACYRMTCDDDNKLTVYVEGDKRVCKREGQKLIFIGFAGTLRCPDPERACRIRKLYGVQTEVVNAVPKYIGLTMKQLASIVIALITLLIALFLFCSIKGRVKRCKYEKELQKKLDKKKHRHHHHHHHDDKSKRKLDDIEEKQQRDSVPVVSPPEEEKVSDEPKEVTRSFFI